MSLCTVYLVVTFTLLLSFLFYAFKPGRPDGFYTHFFWADLKPTTMLSTSKLSCCCRIISGGPNALKPHSSFNFIFDISNQKNAIRYSTFMPTSTVSFYYSLGRRNIIIYVLNIWLFAQLNYINEYCEPVSKRIQHFA